MTTATLVAMVVLTIVTVGAIVGLTVLQPEADNTGTITVVVVLVTTIATSMLSLLKSSEAAKVAREVKDSIKAVHLDLDGKLKSLLDITRKLSFREGEEVGRARGWNEARAQGLAVDEAELRGKEEAEKRERGGSTT